MEKEKSRKSVVNIGTSLMVVILIGLSFAVIAALAISSSKNNYDLSQKLADHTREYYEASNKVEELIASDKWADNLYEINIDDRQVLQVEVKDKKITSWIVKNTGDWIGSDTITIDIDNEM